ncbi:FAD-dependent oxidoreductase [Bosea sp. 685]|uniref:NAD(P)/FAD-dependent oxidoreductase n=1 Tax=Bosea sp. 685 TaxID=3080057 RepID=UPI002892CC6B|nr:FAD-dependent oxidoreductase [Bosea sp. 685]WNJ90874.1 FAD-dependent oxidoreductase [Bosea sp. 685]
MTRRNIRVGIVGAGIIGASVAYHLARRGIEVCVFERGAGPAVGTTGKSFGWVNTLFVDPADARVFSLRRAAVEEYERLAAELPGAFRDASRGSLLWKATPGETENLFRTFRNAGLDVELIAGAELARREPFLRSVPPCALSSPKDIALQPPALAATLLAAAVERGAKLFTNTQVISLCASDGAVTGLVTASEAIAFDLVVLAAGPWTEELLRPLGLSFGLLISPALLLRYCSDRRLLSHIVKSPELEVRQLPDNAMIVARSLKDPLPDAGAIDVMGREMLRRIRALVMDSERIGFEAGVIGQRPMFPDELPRTGHAAGCKGLYLAIGHPGVILAPLLGRLAASEIAGGAAPW